MTEKPTHSMADYLGLLHETDRALEALERSRRELLERKDARLKEMGLHDWRQTNSVSNFFNAASLKPHLVDAPFLDLLNASVRAAAFETETGQGGLLPPVLALRCAGDLGQLWSWKTPRVDLSLPEKTRVVESLFAVLGAETAGMKHRAEAGRALESTVLFSSVDFPVSPLEKTAVRNVAGALLDRLEKTFRQPDGKWTKIHANEDLPYAAVYAASLLVNGGYAYERADFELAERCVIIMESVSGWGNNPLNIARADYGRQRSERLQRALGMKITVTEPKSHGSGPDEMRYGPL